MSVDEAILWERLSRSRRAPVEPSWLEESYSSSLFLLIYAERSAKNWDPLLTVAGRSSCVSCIATVTRTS